MRAALRDALEFLYPDSRGGTRSVRVDVARSGTVAVHVLLQDLAAGDRMRVVLLEGTRRVGAAQWFRLVAVPVEKNTGVIGFTEDTAMGARRVNRPNPHVTRRAPFQVFDAMEPVPGAFTSSAAVQALRLHLPVARRARPGQRDYQIQISVRGETSSLAMRVRIHPVSIPPVGRDSFPVTQWFHLDKIAAFHHLKPWSESHWRMIRRYADLMVHGRQNTFLCRLTDVCERTAQGLVLRRERLRRLVRLFSAAGMHYIEGGHFASRVGGVEGARFANLLHGPLSTSAEGNADIAGAARQLLAEIRRRHWGGRWIQHAADEPNDAAATDYRLLCGLLRRHMPGIPLFDATCSRALVGAVDCWCPHVHLFQRHRDFYARQRAAGDGVWYYTCCEPGGRWLNRLLDQELLRPTLLGWAGALFGLEGFLHWGLNSWQPGVSPFTRSVLETHTGHWHNSLPAGDTHIVYPGSGGPWSSVRLEAQREGFEDLELLRRLRADNPRAAAAVLARVVRGFDDYTTDVRQFRAARRTLLMRLSR